MTAKTTTVGPAGPSDGSGGNSNAGANGEAPPADDQPERLRGYVLARQGVTALVRQAKQALQRQGEATKADEMQKLLARLAEDRFNLAVVGQFKRGKSTLMNAILGRDLLPTGMLPLTSAITTLCYGPQERISLRRQGWALDQEISLAELPEYVTERGNPGNVKGLVEVRLELPVPFLRRGLYFIDTPGIGSARAENTATTMSFLPEADAIIFVTSVEAPLSAAEEGFLAEVARYRRRLFLVVNKTDLLPPQEREDVLAYIVAGLGRALALPEVHLHKVSARMALAAKLGGDRESLLRSGLPELEQALVAFLNAEKARSFLVGVLERAQGLLSGVDAPELATLSEAMHRLGQSLEAGLTETLEAPLELPAAAPAAPLATSPEAPSPTNIAWKADTCPICAHQGQALFDFFVRMQYRLTATESERLQLAAVHGFCRGHTWQFERVASPQSISEGYAHLIEIAAVQMRQAAQGNGSTEAAAIEALLPRQETCPACQELARVENEALHQFLTMLASPDGNAWYKGSAGLCLPHLRLALQRVGQDPLAGVLVRTQTERLEAIAEDMRSYVLKRDALRRSLIRSDEGDAWRRALVQLVGEPTAKPSLPEETGRLPPGTSR
ncbi:MAG: hypothetical protein HPY83_06690 [Anaerolineae bacterium]|nr:hypothetical protein [Anaerolineae bacterium]